MRCWEWFYHTCAQRRLAKRDSEKPTQLPRRGRAWHGGGVRLPSTPETEWTVLNAGSTKVSLRAAAGTGSVRRGAEPGPLTIRNPGRTCTFKPDAHVTL